MRRPRHWDECGQRIANLAWRQTARSSRSNAPAISLARGSRSTSTTEPRAPAIAADDRTNADASAAAIAPSSPSADAVRHTEIDHDDENRPDLDQEKNRETKKSINILDQNCKTAHQT
jgi:hypothetical protein